MDYSHRSITDVRVSRLHRHEDFDGSTISGSVRFQLSTQDGNEFGPHVTIELAADLPEGATIQDVERHLLTAALGVLARLASLTPDEAFQGLEKSQPKQHLPKLP